jgi:putative inorganic carbon (HCO3(-)) transporter
MLRKKPVTGYAAVTRSRRAREKDALRSGPKLSLVVAPEKSKSLEIAKTSIAKDAQTLKRGHAFSYAALFAFTLVLYARPSEFYPSAVTNSMALVVGLMTLGFFVPTQLALEGNITAPLLEVKLVLLFGLLGIASIPLAISPPEAWQEFSGTFIRCIVMFVVIVNVVRTEKRLKGLLYLALGVSVWLSLGAINDYRLGLLTVEGYRVGGRGGGIFGNSNDMALFLVTLVPIAIALLLSARNAVTKCMFGAISLMMMAAIVVTYSRGGFIGLMVALGFLAWRLGNQRRLEILGAGLVLMLGFLVLAPGGYGLRLASIVIPSLDPVGSADARRGELTRSIYVALRHPLLGIGMGNYAPEMSYHGLVTHNSYTQVAAEMGLAALCCYTMFIVSPLRKLAQIVRETFGARVNSRLYYLAVGLQAALLGYMVCSFFASVAYLWYVFYLVGYAVCLRRLYESETGKEVVIEKRRDQKSKLSQSPSLATAP